MKLPNWNKTEKHAWLNKICWGIKWAIATKSGMQMNPTSGGTWRAWMSGWVRHDGDPEVNVTDQGKEFLGEYSEGQQRRAVYQHVTNLESPWENGPTERSNQVLETQYAVARDAYEPLFGAGERRADLAV